MQKTETVEITIDEAELRQIVVNHLKVHGVHTRAEHLVLRADDSGGFAGYFLKQVKTT